MVLKTILTEPNKLLRQISQPVERVGDLERELMNDMLETMYDANGIGLAAIQIGVPKRIIVMDLSKKDEKKDEKKEPRYFVNPIITNQSIKLNTYEEGCLSVPGQFAEIDRPSECDVEYLDYNGEKKFLHATGLLSTCLLHETDHLVGRLFIDYLSKLKKEMIIKKLSKQQVKPDRIIV